MVAKLGHQPKPNDTIPNGESLKKKTNKASSQRPKFSHNNDHILTKKYKLSQDKMYANF